MSKPSNQINRRSFLSRSLCGMGALAVGQTSGLFGRTALARSNSHSKALYATSDYTDNILINSAFMDRQQLDDLHKCLAEIGVTRHQWIVDTFWNIYDDYPHGFDLLANAVESAHAHGIEFYAEIKPFENGGFGVAFPHSMPFSEDMQAFRDLRGIFPVAGPFASQNPHLCLKRKPDTHKVDGPVKTIRLVKWNDSPTRVKPEHLSIWSSSANNHFKQYNGPVEYKETIDWRFRFPKWRQSRILSMEGLDLPEDHHYVLIKCSLADRGGDFRNECGNILELVNGDGELIPHTLGTGRGSLEEHNKGFYQSEFISRMLPYLQNKRVQQEIRDPQKMLDHYREFYNFGEYYRMDDWITLDQEGVLVAACSKPEYMLGSLHPIYPEVQNLWLDRVRYCLDRNVDGMNFRVANHTRLANYWEYGFNEPVLEKANGKTDYTTISRINGDAYTQFLRKARQMIKAKGKGLTIHLHAGMLRPDDRPGRLSSLPPNFEWQWKTWAKEIADELEFRGGFILRPWNKDQVLDIYSSYADKVNKPFHYQSDFHSMTNDEGRRQCKQHEVELVKSHPGIDGFVLYETANYTRLNEKGRIENKPYIVEVMKNY
ncbi:hypothetical protein GF406_10020 [candidate division KSB1 bacterium]|nr:hypothetical protein [candidate division KSB1 bacterium]